MPFWMDTLRSWLTPARRPGRPGRTRFEIEQLETRDTPTITTTTLPVWQNVGPVGITGSAALIIPAGTNDLLAGATEVAAVDPFSTNRVVIGSVSGGIWSTENYLAAQPTWRTSTDNLPSLAISALAFSPVNTPGQRVVYAGTGSYTNGGLGPTSFAAQINSVGTGGIGGQVYKSTDGGVTWSQVGGNIFAGLRIRSIVPTTLNNGNTVFLATHDGTTGAAGTTGVYRSDDGGQTWTRLSGGTLPNGMSNGLPDLPVTSLVADPVNVLNPNDPAAPKRIFAAVAGQSAQSGVYMLDTTAANPTWVNITNNLPASATQGIKLVLSVSKAGARPVYLGALDANTGQPVGIYRGVPFASGNNTVFVWTAVGPNGQPPDINPGGQGETNFSILADQTSEWLVYAAGDRIPGAVGNVARGDAQAGTWTTMAFQPTPPPAASPGTVTPANPVPKPTSAPHSDERSMVFGPNNDLIVVGDGGVYRVTNPQGQSRAPAWSSLDGNNVTFELYRADIDDRNTADPSDDIYMAAAQDNGLSEGQFGKTFTAVARGDGVLVLADPAGGYRYYASQGFFLNRRNPNGTVAPPPGTVIGSGGKTVNAATGAPLIENFSFTQYAALSSNYSSDLLLGGFQTLYLSTDHADTFRSVGGIAGGNAVPVPNVTGLVISQSLGTQEIPFAAYVGTDDGNISQSFDCSSGTGNFVLTDFAQVAGGLPAVNIKMDPNNPLVAVAVTDQGVYKTINGKNWVNITGDLLTRVTPGNKVSLFGLDVSNNGTTNPNDDIVIVGGYGGVFTAPVTGGAWKEFGTGLPNVLVGTVKYDALSDTLIAGTYGRGIWRVTNALKDINNGPSVIVTGDAFDNQLAVYPDTTDPSKFFVTDGTTTQEYDSATYQTVVLRGLGGTDTITVGAPNARTPGRSDLLRVNVVADGGGDLGDLLQVDDSANSAGRRGTVSPGVIGGATGDTILGSASKVSYSGFDNGSARIRLGTGDDTLNFDDSLDPNPATYTLGATRFTWSVNPTPIDYSGADLVGVTGGSGNNTYQINGTGGAVSTTVNDGAGNSTINVQAGATVGAVSVNGNGGTDTVVANGTPGTDLPTVAITDPTGGGNFGGLGSGFFFGGVEAVSYVGQGGNDALSWFDGTGASYGTPTDPASGVVVRPTGLGTGSITVARGNVLPVVNYAGTPAGLTVNGDPDGSGDKDVLTILGTSTNGLQSPFGEVTAPNGQDTIFASDTRVSIQNVSGGAQLSLTLGQGPGGTPSFGTVYVAAGNESGRNGDNITAVPSGSLNLVIDGMGPGLAKPGDQVTVQASGGTTTTRVNDPTLGPPQARVTAADGSSVGLVGIETGAGAFPRAVAVGTGAGVPARVQVFDSLSGALRLDLFPFPGFTGGVSVATGDVTGDGIDDVIVGAGPGGGPEVDVFDGNTGDLFTSFFAYEPSFSGGVNVSAGDFDRDGFADVAIGTGVGGGPRVRIISGQTLAPIKDVFVYESTFRGGVNVSAGDVNGDGVPDIVTSTGSGGGPRVVVFDGSTLNQLASFFAFSPTSRAGFYAAAGDVNGDGLADIVTGAGYGEPGRVRVFSGRGQAVLADFIVYDPFNPANPSPNLGPDVGIRVAVSDVNGDGIGDVVTGKGPGASPTLRVYQVGGVNPQTNALFSTLKEIRHQDVFDPSYLGGIYVGGS